ncbi:MAG: hypothetical protein Q8R28_12290 [Dehalococcoidia bacterium]|nr:hypothetical protein [Dehalococcoidia bacterium]
MAQRGTVAQPQNPWVILGQRAKPVNGERPYLRALHPRQREWVLDRAKRKAAICGRRAGKSRGGAAWLAEGAELDGSKIGLSLYVALRRNNARGIMWESGLKKLSDESGLGLELKETDGQLMVCHPNGHKIWLAGCANVAEIEKFRGFAFKRVLIDECQTIDTYLETLVEDVIDPTLIDCDGELALTGTPGVIPAGFFYDVTGDAAESGTSQVQEWSVHHWTIRDNPYIENVEEQLQRRMDRRGWSDDHPTFMREWRGLWVKDEGALVYPYDGLRNAVDRQLFEQIPKDELRYALAIDLGASDEPTTAFALGATRRGYPDVYLLEAWKKGSLIPSAIAAHVDRYRSQYSLQSIVADEGALGKGYANEMRERYGIPVKAAQKTSKRAFQEMFAGDLKSGMIKAFPHECSAWLDEIQILPWNEDRSAEDDRFANHAADAALYLYRELRPIYQPEEERKQPARGSREWLLREQKEQRDKMIAEAKKRQRANKVGGIL